MIQRLRESMHWKSPQSPRKKKARMSKSKFKAMMFVVSISGGLCTLIWCLKVRLSIRFIIKVFWRHSVNVCDEGDQTCGRMPHWFFITTTRQHTTRYLWRGFGEKQHSSDGTSPYSTDLEPCDFYLFPKIKSALKGTRFESVDAVKAKATQLLNSLTQDDLQHCFQQWKIRMEWCRDRGGDYTEGDNISIVWFFFNKGLEHESGFFITIPRTSQIICTR